MFLIPVGIRLIGAFDGYAEVVRLFLRQGFQFHPQFAQVQAGDFLVELLGQGIYLADFILVGLGEEGDLGQGLVREGIRHHKAGMPRRAAKVHEASFRKKDDNLYLNLSASDVTFGPEESDSIKGTMSFKGTTGSKDIPEKKGKKGAYRLFDAFSSEKTADDQYVYTWVHFVDFSSDRPDWLGPKKGIEAEGDLELSYFNERLSLNCIVSSLSFWEKPSSNQ